jgi:hypothetical protein
MSSARSLRHLASAFAVLGVSAAALVPLPAQAQALFDGQLSGAAVVPPNGSPATGTTQLSIEGDTLSVELSFSGLGSNSVGSHIHCCAAPGVNASVAILYPAFPLGVTSGSYANNFDLASASTYLAAFVTAHGGTVAGARAALLDGLANNQSYACVHTTTFPGAEIRSQFDFEAFADGFESGNPNDWSAFSP